HVPRRRPLELASSAHGEREAAGEPAPAPAPAPAASTLTRERRRQSHKRYQHCPYGPTHVRSPDWGSRLCTAPRRSAGRAISAKGGREIPVPARRTPEMVALALRR